MIRILRNNDVNFADGAVYSREKLGKSFLMARDACARSAAPEKESFEYEDESGKTAFYLSFEKNYQMFSPNTEKFLHYEFWKYDFQKSGLNIDYTLLDRYDSFVFFEIEEYTFAIIELIIEKLPTKKVFILDGIGRKIWTNGEVQFIDEPEQCWGHSNGRICCINSVNYNMSYLTKYKIPVFNSINVMHSLLWASNVEHLGSLNKGKIIFLIDYDTGQMGLMDIMKFTCTYIMLARERGWIPVVHLNRKPNQYLMSTEDDMWEYFFEPVSRISYEEALHSQNVIRASRNEFRLWDTACNPLQRESFVRLHNTFRGDENNLFYSMVRMNYATLKAIHEKIPQEVICGEALGVVCRGTDYSTEASVRVKRSSDFSLNASAEETIEATEIYLKKYNYKYVFLATEDEVVYAKFQKKFGDKLICVAQKRVSWDYKNNSYRSVSSLLEIKDGREFGRTYLSIMYALSICPVLIVSKNCGVVQGAWALSQRRFKDFAVVTQKGIREEKEKLQNSSIKGKQENLLNRPILSWQIHCQMLGWTGMQYEGLAPQEPGKAIEALRIYFTKPFLNVNYATYHKKEGWGEVARNSEISGTTGKHRELSGIKIYLDEKDRDRYSILYRACFGDVWSEWVKDGYPVCQEDSMTGIEVKLINTVK